MAKFNSKEYELNNSSVFTCNECGNSVNRKIANSGCPKCKNTIFKVATRTGTPNIFDPDKYDPYLRQKKAPFSNNQGDGYNLTRVGDEDWEGSGLGGRFRGKDFPSDFSSDSNEYEEQRRTDIPGSMDDMISDGDFGGENSPGDFSSPEDALSSENTVSRDLDKTDGGSLDSRLRSTRIKDRVFPESADSVYRNVSHRQRGNKR